ncbi:MAG: hypothetical protein U1E67_08995 [Hyphomicrobiales bacterium]
MGLLDTSGPARVTFAEFSPFFESDGLSFDASGALGTQKSLGDEFTTTGLYRNASISVGQFHFQSDGYRENNEIETDIINGIGTFALSPEFTLFGEYRYRNSEGGDIPLDFDIGDFDDSVLSDFKRKLARGGFHAQLSPQSDLIGVYTWGKLGLGSSVDDDFSPKITTTTDVASHGAQIQNIWQSDTLRNITGVHYVSAETDTLLTIEGIFELPESFSTEYFNAYSYLYINAPTAVTWTIGGSVAGYKEDTPGGADIEKFLPKLGVRAEIADGLSVRAAYFRSLKPSLVNEQVIEPTAIAGFNQYFDTSNAAVIDSVGAALDLQLTKTLMVGAEGVGRKIAVPVGLAPDEEINERTYRGYAYMTLSDKWALASAIMYEDIWSKGGFDFESWQTTSVPVTVSYFDESGWFGSIGIEFVDHSVKNFGLGGSDMFSPVNATLGYRLPNNRGVMTIEAQNLLDEEFNFQNRTLRPDITAGPRYAPDLTILARGTFSF